MLGVSQPSVSAWFNNKADPSERYMDQLCKYLDTTRAVILGYDPVKAETKSAMLEEAGELMEQLNDKQLQEVMNYMGYLIEERKRKNGQA